MNQSLGSRTSWLCGLSGILVLVAAVPTASSPAPRLLVAVQCFDASPPRTEFLEDDEALVEDNCIRRPLAYITEQDLVAASNQEEPEGLPEGESETVAPTIKPGWPRIFPRFEAQTLATADLGDPRGRATILHEDDGRTHALAPDGTPITGWPILLPQPFTSTMPAVMNVDEVGPDEILLGLGGVHLLSHLGVEWPGWPFLVPGTGFQGVNPIATRLVEGEPIRIVTSTARSRFFVLDQQPAALPGWPVQIPKGVFALPLPANVAVGDMTGDAQPDLAITIANESQAFAFTLTGSLLPGFPIYAGGNPDPFRQGASAHEPSLADLDSDGALEMVFWAIPAPGGRAGIVALRGDGTILPGWPQHSQSGAGNFGVAAGDVDGDGDLEVLASTVNGGEPGAGGVYLWHGDGTPVSGWPKFFPNVSFPNPVAIADVDGDGLGDPIVGGFSVLPPTNGLVYAWKGNGQLIPGFPIVIPFRRIGFASPTIDDLEGDGLADLGITTEQALNILFPGRVHWFDLGVPYRAEGMEWPTRSHDMARTAAYQPPVRRVPMEVQLAPPQLNSRAPAPPLTVLLRLPAEETSRPRILRLRFMNGERIPELEGQFLEDDGETVVFRLDGGAVRALLPGPGEHTLGFWTEAVGGLGGVLYEGEATLTLREVSRPSRPGSQRDRHPRIPLTGESVPLAPSTVSAR